ncbi:Iron-sulfur cluster-binding protein, partial [hydrothermal vent metagenome]
MDPANTVAIAEAMFDIIDLVGEFEKPIFVSYDKSICAHSRSGQTGCNNCIDNCPTSAITSDGDHILVNNEICDGCGHCSASCPTGAIAYAMPQRSDLIGRSQVLLSTYLGAGGKNAVLLVHESSHGGDLISAIARFGDGLAENILPFSVHSTTHIGHDALAAFFTSGAQSVILLVSQKNRNELDALNIQIDLTNTFLDGMGFDENMRVSLLVEDDPDIVAENLSAIPAIKTPAIKNFTASKNKRETARLAIGNLNAMAPQKLELLALPTGSPYGAISINTDTCTLCLACVSACPASALGDHEERPQVSFTEHACVQCGLCKTTCPENAISLTSQFNFDKSALSPVVLNSEEPLECTRCGKPFGSKSAIDKVIGILAGKNPMFQTSKQLDLLKMCDDCRVISMSETEKDPMTFGTVPQTLTAE